MSGKVSSSLPLDTKSILANKFIPASIKDLNLFPVQERWICSSDLSHSFKYDACNHQYTDSMNDVISALARNFIPAVPCMCDKGGTKYSVHGEILFIPSVSRTISPNFEFALKLRYEDQKMEYKTAPSGIVDLDETSSTVEYSSTFQNSLRLEYEEYLRLYEHYSLYEVKLKPFEVVLDSKGSNPYQKAVIFVDGISDARPSLKIGDIVLVRPLKPIFNVTHMWGQSTPISVEIESRVLDVVRGRRGKKDHVIFSWGIDQQQTKRLDDSTWERSYNIRFIPSVIPFERSLTALDWVTSISRSYPCALDDILFPTVAPKVKILREDQRTPLNPVVINDSKPLNELQSSFVWMVRARTYDHEFNKVRPPMILTGPAGTGKTKTLLFSIADVLGLLSLGNNSQLNRNRVLVCAPSHTACDVITRRLSAFLLKETMFRMYDSERPIITVPSYILPFTYQLSDPDRFSLPPPSVWANLRVVICTCLDAHILYRAKITNEAVRAKRQCFRTFLLSESNNLQLPFKESIAEITDPYFSHLFVDEAAQATEPELNCPLSCVIDPHPGVKKVEIALIGDPRQLSPQIYSDTAARYGLGRSFMERLLRRPVKCMGGGDRHMMGPVLSPDSLFDYNTNSLMNLIRYYATIDGQEQLTIFLTENYRGHPSFLMMPSSLFYFDRLKCSAPADLEEWRFWCARLREIEAISSPVVPFKDIDQVNDETNSNRSSFFDVFFQVRRQYTWPVHYCGVKGVDTSFSLENFTGTDSWQNAPEAEMTVKMISTLVKGGVRLNDIGVMTPFRGQVDLIRKLLRMINYHDVNVGTVENYQGVEQDVILFSVTRSNTQFVANDIKRRMGVFGHMRHKQANVALTRAKKLFIVIGDPEIMWKDHLWMQYLCFCFRNGLWFGKGLDNCQLQKISNPGKMKFSSILEEATEANTSIVVSTIEKLHRQ